MPTAQRIFTPPASLFGDLGEWSLEQHTESIPFRDHTLRIQTSDHQTDDGTRGTWHFALLRGAQVVAQTQVGWDDTSTPRYDPDGDGPTVLDYVRRDALAWAEKVLDAGAETVREDIAALAETSEG